MDIVVKAILTLVACIAVLGAAFYAWIWWAWTPKAPSKGAYLHEVITQGVTAQDLIEGGVAYEIWWSAPDPQSEKAHGVLLWRPGKEAEKRDIVYVKGRPVPKAVKITRPGFVEVLFDAPLQGGQDGLNIEVDENFYRYDTVRVSNGAIDE